MEVEISFGNMFVSKENYEFSFSEKEFLRLVRLTVSEDWLTAEQIKEATNG